MSKTKSGLSETPKATPATPKATTATPKVTPATPKVTPPTPKGTLATSKVSRLSRGGAKSQTDSASPLQSSHNSVEPSPRSINSKPAVDRRSPKVTILPEKPQALVVRKGSELRAQLNLVQEDLKKAEEQISSIEKEKAQALDELKQAQKKAEEANEKLQEALVGQKRAEENSEIEKFRAVELEQAGIEAAQKKEEEWQKELKIVRNQHAVDVAALLSATQELQKVKQELAVIADAKIQALNHADDATKVAEIHAEKVEILSAEVMRLKGLLDSKLETEAKESNMTILNLEEEIKSLKQELEKAKDLEHKLIEKEASIEKLNVEIEAAKMAESYARNLVEEWKSRVDDLEHQLEEAKKLERSASESLHSVMKQLEDNNSLVHDAQTEIASLKEKVELLEMTIGQQKTDLEKSDQCLSEAKEETMEMEEKVELLKLDLETLKEEKAQALTNEKLAASSIQSLLEEKNKLVDELDNCWIEEEKSKKAMESLASALHEVSAEAREAKEKLLSIQAEHESYEAQIEDLRLVLKASNEKYEALLEDAKHEINFLKSRIAESKSKYDNTNLEWEQKEQNLVNCAEKSKEENTRLGKEIDRLDYLLKQAEEEASVMRDEEVQLKNSVKEVEAEVISLQEALGQARIESVKMKESLLDKENELQSIIEENEELRNQEAIYLTKIEELSKLLEEAKAKKDPEENGELTDCEKDYDLLPKVVEFSEENGHIGEDKHVEELPPQQLEEPTHEFSQLKHNGFSDDSAGVDASKTEAVEENPKENDNKEKEDDSVEVEFKMWESCKIEKKEISPEREAEEKLLKEEADSKVGGGESNDQVNGISSTENADDGSTSPTKDQHHKKKKPLLRKFGSLLKKKGTVNQK